MSFVGTDHGIEHGQASQPPGRVAIVNEARCVPGKGGGGGGHSGGATVSARAGVEVVDLAERLGTVADTVETEQVDVGDDGQVAAMAERVPATAG